MAQSAQNESVQNMWLKLYQGALKGTNLRGQDADFRRFSLIFAGSRLFPENKTFENRKFRRKPQMFAGNRRKPQEPAENRDWRSSPWVRPLKRGPTIESPPTFQGLPLNMLWRC